MPKPQLPSLTPPPIPSGRVAREEPKKGSNFFFIVALTFLIVWSFQLLTRKNEEPKDEPAATAQEAEPIAPLPVPSAEESTRRLADLPAETLAAAQKENPTVFHTLGSADPESSYRMLVTLSSRGASVKRLELNEKTYRDCSDQTGYLGQIVGNESLCAADLEAGKKGVAVQVVGAGTPAQQAGLEVGDRIVAVKRSPRHAAETAEAVEIDSFDTLRGELLKTRPGEVITLDVVRAADADNADAAAEKIDVTLSRAPISLLRPSGPLANYDDYKNLAGLQGSVFAEPDDYFPTGGFDLKSTARKRNSDPASFLMTLADYDATDKLDWPKPVDSGKTRQSVCRSPLIERELPELDYRDSAWTSNENALRGGNWELLADESNESQAVFRTILLGRNLEVRKTYRLEPKEPVNGKKAAGAPEYHLTLSIEFRNLDPRRGHSVSYYLDGPTGLPIEGAWYASGRKTGPGWGSYGLRDLVVGLNGGRSFHVIKCVDVAAEKKMPSDPVDIDYLGVDTQYFQCSLLPERDENLPWQGEYMPLRVGARIENLPTFTNTSFRLKSPALELAAAGTDGDRASQNFTIFAGPKQQSVLDAYGLGNTLVYGWFAFISKPLVALLHFFRNYMVFNYGLAIILLTVLVRLAMFPLSRKQILSSLKMQQVQPQLNALKEKYKDKPQEMMAAQQALWKKHKINPLGGCLPLLVQMPIFIGLYKALSLDVNLYGTPLFSESFRWCGNLAAPDMMINWSHFWDKIGWNSFNLGQGMFQLGPYFNLLPMLTIVLFLVQQKYMMPPPTGTEAEQAQQRSMRRMMNIMMIFFGVMFFKVPSGLCVYFVASSLWALLERRFHPKVSLAADGAESVIDIAPISPRADGGAESAAAARKNRSRRTAPPKPEKQTGLKGWWNGLVEQAKEQQKLAKSDAERRAKNNRRRGG